MSSVFDLIVVGGGGAGLCAALAAREQGASVLLVSKTPIGKANCTAFGGGGFTYAGPGTPWQDHYQKTLTTGRRINDPTLLEVFSQEAPTAVPSLQRFGVQMRERPNGATVAPWAPNATVGGMGLTTPLTETARRVGVQFLEGHMAYSVLLNDSKVSGLCTLNLANGLVETWGAKSVVMAPGGGGRIFGRTNNPLRTTGDGYALLHDLGLPLRDMEFVQFYPMGLAEEQLPVWFIGLNVIDDVPVTDRQGREFLKALLPEWGLKTGGEANLFARDRAAIAIAKKWYEGDEVWLHLNQLAPEKWQEPYYRAIRKLTRHDCDFTQKPVRVKPLEHYMSGGVIIHSDGSTAVEGLYACGEVTGGVDGANRIGGNAFANITVFGQRAGTAAAHYARSVSAPRVFSQGCLLPDEVGHWAQSVGPSPSALKRRLNGIMDTYVGPLRSAQGLAQALAELSSLEKDCADMKVENSADLRDAMELKGMIKTARLIATAARQRQESRGVHYRLDYPHEEAQWERALQI